MKFEIENDFNINYALACVLVWRSWHKNAICIIGPLYTNSCGIFPIKRPVMQVLIISFVVLTYVKYMVAG